MAPVTGNRVPTRNCGYALRRCSSPHDAADVVAETFAIDRSPVRLAAAIKITRGTHYCEARIVDPLADRKRFTAAFAKYGT